MLGGGETEAPDHWLGRFPAKPYGGLIFQGSAVRGTSTGLPRDRIMTCAMGVLRKTPLWTFAYGVIWRMPVFFG
jgi:hypothetical protein